MSSVLSIRALGAGYDEVDVISDVSIEVPEGSVVSVIGPNGAGKSTLLKAVYGLIRPRRGQVLLGTEETKDITGWRPDRVTAAGMNYVPQLDNVFANLSVIENLELGAFTDRSRLSAGLERVFAWFPLLAERRRGRAGTLSGGQRQMLALARALMSDPKVLLLDEPSAGLAPRVVDEVFERIQAINAAGVAIVMR